MATDYGSLQAATISVFNEILKQADGLAKQLQSLAPPQEMNSPSSQYLLDTAGQLEEAIKSIRAMDEPEQDSKSNADK